MSKKQEKIGKISTILILIMMCIDVIIYAYVTESSIGDGPLSIKYFPIVLIAVCILGILIKDKFTRNIIGFFTLLVFNIWMFCFTPVSISGKPESICANGPRYVEGKEGDANFVSCSEIVNGEFSCSYVEKEIYLILPNKITTKQVTCNAK